ncbi:hypothetical protein N431DRAFT_528799 [Stipitochalara longipes BDJ]|nr:hypothetical protein N431DRAFT_528799 [Stipitochalara longipes BDJ]
MSSQEQTDHCDMYHESLSHSGAPHPYLQGPYNDNSNNSARVPKQYTAQYEHGENWEVTHDEAPARLASLGDSVLQGFYGWDDHCLISGLPNQIFYSNDKWNQNSLVELETSFLESTSWGETSSAPSALGAEVTVRAELMENTSQSAMDLLQMPVSDNPRENFHSYQHGLFEIERSREVMEEIESADLLTRNTTLFEASSTDFVFTDKYFSTAAPLNGGFESRLQEHNINDEPDNVPSEQSHHHDPTPSVSQPPNHDKSLNFVYNQMMGFGPPLDFLNDSFMALPPQSSETTYIPHYTSEPSTSDSRSARLCLGEVSQIFTGTFYPQNTSLELENIFIPSDTLQFDTSHNSGLLRLLGYHDPPDKVISHNENTMGVNSKITREDNLLSETMNWQHISSTELRPHEAIKDVKQKRKSGRRYGRLKPETAKNAREMRHLRACLPCAIMKMSCSPGPICKRCRALSPNLLGSRICTRAHLEDFNDLLFPVVLFVSHLRHNSVSKLSSELSLGFVGIDIDVGLTCGSEYPPLYLAVSEFAPKSYQVTRVPTIITRSANDLPLFEDCYPPPIAFRSACNDLVERCRNHIKLVIKQERNCPGLITESGHKINRLSLKAIARYHGSARSSRTTVILDKAMMLHTIYIFMATTLTMTESSKEHLTDHLQKPTRVCYHSNIASRLLNRQIKSAMHTLRQQLMREVLEELEKELKTRSKAVWAPCFCVALILCMCVEDAQIAMDAFAMHTRILGAEQDAPSSQATIEACRKLDDLLFIHLLELFHGVYRTHQTSKALNSSRVYNPIRDGPDIDVKEGLDQESADLALEFRQIMANHKHEIVERAAKPSFADDHDSLARHMAFREGNSGRLVSAFLKSFHSS